MGSEDFGYGIDRIVRGQAGLPEGRRLGLLTNDAARTADDPTTPSRLALQKAGASLVRLFSPEHGLTAAAADGAAVPDDCDNLTGLPIVSLYGERQRPERSMLEDLDAVLVDLPDIGSRFYTYLWSVSHLLEACCLAGVPVVVLDRPNPIGGDLKMAEGPILDETTCASFLGRMAMPIRHSLTLGELTSLWNDHRQLNADLRVVPAIGWNRVEHQPATGAAFLATSPSMPSYPSALLYPGVGLFEATNLSVGRGTTSPFQQIGAPWLDAASLCGVLAELDLEGVFFEPTRFTPLLPPHQEQECQGVLLRVTNPASLRPVATGLLMLTCVREISRGNFAWTPYPTAANPTGTRHFELLVGRTDLAALLETGSGDLQQKIQSLTRAPDWDQLVAPHLCY